MNALAQTYTLPLSVFAPQYPKHNQSELSLLDNGN